MEETSQDIGFTRNNQWFRYRAAGIIIKDDAEGGDFYYLGDLTIVPSTVEELVRPLESGNESIVTMNFKLDNPVPDTLYRYITNK